MSPSTMWRWGGDAVRRDGPTWPSERARCARPGISATPGRRGCLIFTRAGNAPGCSRSLFSPFFSTLARAGRCRRRKVAAPALLCTLRDADNCLARNIRLENGTNGARACAGPGTASLGPVSFGPTSKEIDFPRGKRSTQRENAHLLPRPFSLERTSIQVRFPEKICPAAASAGLPARARDCELTSLFSLLFVRCAR